MNVTLDTRLFSLAAFGLMLHAADGRAGSPDGHFGQSTDIVTDTKTGLSWQQPASSAAYTFEAADTYCVGRGTGWRVPTAKELLTLVDTTAAIGNSVVIDTEVFSETQTDKAWWSSDIVSGASSQAWVVEFGIYGGLTSEERTTPLYVRCVK